MVTVTTRSPNSRRQARPALSMVVGDAFPAAPFGRPTANRLKPSLRSPPRRTARSGVRTFDASCIRGGCYAVYDWNRDEARSGG
jgi:hypothetical protein